MNTLEKAKERASSRPLRVVFPESEDPRVAQAMEQLAASGMADPLQVGPATQAQFDALISHRPMRSSIAERMLERPLIRAAAMLANNEADVMVAGAASPTRRVIEAAALTLGYSPGVQTASSFFLMEFPDGREMILADCAVIQDPTGEELADIARSSANSARKLLGRADVALLSYATGHSGIGASVEKVRFAATATGYLGPIQADSALNSAIAAQKGASGAGVANTLIFPDLNSGNIAYKLLKELAGAKAYGPILQGFRKPVCDLSRGATVDEIVASSILSVALAQPAIEG
ncbi:phosphate acyltransferase [Aliiroseovarius sp. KMU-50]|uniref:Phosphate acyltransferase n=1 Tax=Aliiroseovarius salicola TaxID=3009082 RepID=A0ABT4W145_9RHOB|nr:phosphate acyltransferase [Aliiroseovarius sp. KMU-50]MDA5094231.1 phosphate acyltransferase [Aliiroseovarius sp. KMU-50]